MLPANPHRAGPQEAQPPGAAHQREAPAPERGRPHQQVDPGREGDRGQIGQDELGGDAEGDPADDGRDRGAFDCAGRPGRVVVFDVRGGADVEMGENKSCHLECICIFNDVCNYNQKSILYFDQAVQACRPAFNDIL